MSETPSKIFVVYGEAGDGYESCQWNVIAFLTEEDAQTFVDVVETWLDINYPKQYGRRQNSNIVNPFDADMSRDIYIEYGYMEISLLPSFILESFPHAGTPRT